jgi:hypothetical protein
MEQAASKVTEILEGIASTHHIASHLNTKDHHMDPTNSMEQSP